MKPNSDAARILWPALQIGLTQAGIGLAAALFWWSLGDGRDALAALAGGSVPALLNLYVGLRLFLAGSAHPREFLAAFYRAQAVKLGLAVGLLALGAIAFPDQFLPLISTLALALAVHWFALLWFR